MKFVNQCFSLLITAIFVFSSSIIYASAYKWVDENGQVHYSARPPMNQEAQSIKTKKHTPSPASKKVAENNLNDDDDGLASDADHFKQADQYQAQQRLKREETLKNKEAMAQNCETAKQNYEAIKDTHRINFTNAEGETEVLADEALQAKIESIKADLQKYCFHDYQGNE